MSRFAHSDVAAVAEVQSAVLQFAREAEEIRRSARRAADRVLSRLGEELRDRRWSVEQARRELQQCQSKEGANCGQPAAALARAEERLRAAERAVREGEQAIQRFVPSEQRFGREVDGLAREVLTLTRGQQGALEQYLASSGGGGGSGGPGAGPSGGGAARGAGTGLPNGVQMISLELIDWGAAGPVTGPEDFTKGYSPEDLQWGLEALQEVVLPAVRAGKGMDYFSERDAKVGRTGSGSRCYRDTYAGFFEQNDAITLNAAAGGRYTVGNGRHRIWVARRLGLTEIPALMA